LETGDWRLEIGTPGALSPDMGEIAERLKRRTMRFSLDVCALIQQLPSGEPGWTVQHQLTKAATSVAFNYRAACRGRSHAEYTAKIGLVSEESDESLGWLEFIEAAELLKSEELQRLLAEARELSAIMSASYGTARYKDRDKRKGERGAQGPNLG
jgi:four helix bundle protein